VPLRTGVKPALPIPPPPPHPRTKWTRRVPHPVLIGHAAPGFKQALQAVMDNDAEKRAALEAAIFEAAPAAAADGPAPSGSDSHSSPLGAPAAPSSTGAGAGKLRGRRQSDLEGSVAGSVAASQAGSASFSKHPIAPLVKEKMGEILAAAAFLSKACTPRPPLLLPLPVSLLYTHSLPP
jgi:hypothetical protein